MSDDYTYKRVLKNGEWGMERVPATGKLPTGSPVFPRVAPQIKAGEQPGAFSSMMDRLQNPQHYYTTDNTSEPQATIHVPIIIDSDTLKQRGMLGRMLVARLNAYTEKGFKWVIEAESGNGPGKVSMLNEHLGQLFVVYFRHQEELARWAMGENVKPYRIERKNVPFTEDPGTTIPIPDGDDPVDFVITGGRPAKQDSSFGRMVELDEG